MYVPTGSFATCDSVGQSTLAVVGGVGCGSSTCPGGFGLFSCLVSTPAG